MAINFSNRRPAKGRGFGLFRIFSDLVARTGLASRGGFGYGGDRDIWEQAGYKLDLSFEDYEAMYLRQDIAGKIVDLPAVHAWRKGFTLESDNSKLADEFRALDKRLGLSAELMKLDKFVGIGRYGILYFGFAGDSGRLAEPVSTQEKRQIAYVRAMTEGSAPIKDIIEETSDPKFGLPETYRVELADGITRTIHHTRVLHVAENTYKDRALGTPRLERVANRLYDMLKVVASGSEATWQTINRGLAADLRDDAEMDEDDEQALSDELDEYYHGLRRFIRTRGIDITSLPGESVDPTGIFKILLSLVSAASDIPQRLLIGSERGELASNQDEKNWNKIITSRQTNHLRDNVIMPVIERFMGWSVLPRAEYALSWPNLHDTTAVEELEVLEKIVEIIKELTYPAPADEILDVEKLIDWIMSTYAPKAIEANRR